MTEINWGLAQTDPIGEQARAYSYADKVRQSAASYQAGAQYAKGDYAGAATTQAQAGDIPQAQATQEYSQKTAAAGQQYIASALPVFDAIAKAHANDPDKGASAIAAAFDHIAPEAKAITGANDQSLASFKNALVTDTAGTIARLQAQIPMKYQEANGRLYGLRGNTATPLTPEVPKFGTAAPGSSILPENQAAVDALNGPSASGGSQQPGMGTPPAPGGSSPAPATGQLIASADPNAMHAVESGGNPNAVSPKGAMGVSQVMPATAADPGYGVAPARDNSPAELQRVGDQTLAAYTQHYGNAALGHIAYNWGPGNTDKWLQGGADFAKLPAETQTYLGRIAVAQAVPQNQSQQPGQAQGPARIGQPYGQARPVWHPPTAEEAKQYPGAVAMNINGEPKYPPATVMGQTAANGVTLGTQDPTSKSILAQAGISNPAFMVLTGNSSQLPRDSASRAKAQKEAEMFANDRGVDVSTLQSQYKAYNNTLQTNIQKSNALEILSNEVQGTVANLSPVADKIKGSDLRWSKAGVAYLGGLQNDPNAQQYAQYLTQLRADLAGFNAVSGGKMDQHGNAHADDSDMRTAESVIKDGLNSGGARGLAQAVAATSAKNRAIVSNAATEAQKNIWTLFGVGQNYDKVHGVSTASAAPAGANVIRYDAKGNRINK